MNKLFVVPAKENSIIRFPNSDRKLEMKGAFVPDIPYWRRRIMERDVLNCTKEKFDEMNKPVPPVKEVKPEPEVKEKVAEEKEKVAEVKTGDKKETKKETKSSKRKSGKKT